jgi:hypothetical protein
MDYDGISILPEMQVDVRCYAILLNGKRYIGKKATIFYLHGGFILHKENEMDNGTTLVEEITVSWSAEPIMRVIIKGEIFPIKSLRQMPAERFKEWLLE